MRKLLCTEELETQCESCGSPVIKDCGKPATWAVFMGDSGDDPDFGCDEHPLLAEGFHQTPINNVRKHNNIWEVRWPDGTWHDEAEPTPEECARVEAAEAALNL